MLFKLFYPQIRQRTQKCTLVDKIRFDPVIGSISSLIYSSTGHQLINRSPEGLRRERLTALVLRANLEPFDRLTVQAWVGDPGPELVEGQGTKCRVETFVTGNSE